MVNVARFYLGSQVYTWTGAIMNLAAKFMKQPFSLSVLDYHLHIFLNGYHDGCIDVLLLSLILLINQEHHKNISNGRQVDVEIAMNLLKKIKFCQFPCCDQIGKNNHQ